MTLACTSAGPFRCRAYSTARDMASYEAMTSQPSHSSSRRAGNPATSLEILPPAVFTSTGVEMAYPLSSTRKTTGSFRLDAVFIASQNSPCEVVPSPVVTSTTSSRSVGTCSAAAGFWSARSHASAQPTAWRNWVPVGLEALTMLRSFCPQWLGICRPPEFGSSAAATAERSCSVAVMPRPRQRARSR